MAEGLWRTKESRLVSAAAFRTRDLHMTTSRHVCVSGMNDLERFFKNLIATLFIVTLLHQARAASAT